MVWQGSQAAFTASTATREFLEHAFTVENIVPGQTGQW
jgi:hypothetical protein